MQEGDTFLWDSGEGEGIHLWIVLSNTGRFPDQVLIVNISHSHEWTDPTLVLNPNDHPWITKFSFVYYAKMRKVTAAQLNEWEATKQLRKERPASTSLLSKIRRLARESDFACQKLCKLMREQGIHLG